MKSTTESSSSKHTTTQQLHIWLFPPCPIHIYGKHRSSRHTLLLELRAKEGTAGCHFYGCQLDFGILYFPWNVWNGVYIATCTSDCHSNQEKKTHPSIKQSVSSPSILMSYMHLSLLMCFSGFMHQSL